jgi:hypothetical protein
MRRPVAAQLPNGLARSTARAGLVAALLALGGCGQAVDATASRARSPTAATAAPAQTLLPTLVTPPSPRPAATAALTEWAVTDLMPQGDVDLPDGRVERSYRVALATGPLERNAAVLRLQAAPPGVEVVRAELALAELPAHARLSPPGAVLLRHSPALSLDAGALQWVLQDTPPGPASVQGRLLAGLATLQAQAAIVGHQAAPDPLPRALLLAQLQPEATVAAVNQALRQAGVRIVQMRSGNHGLSLRPLSGDAGAADRAQRQLSQAAVFSAVWLQPAPPAPTAAHQVVRASLSTDCVD